jgi:hypothetical protein
MVFRIGEGLFPECIGLMQARRSAIHAVLPIWKSRPDCIFDDPAADVVNIGQAARLKRKAPTPGPSGSRGLCAHNLYPWDSSS